MKEKKSTIHIAKKCKYCREWYQDCIKSLRKIKNKDIRDKLRHLFETLWLNNCGDFDIIYYEFAEKLYGVKLVK